MNPDTRIQAQAQELERTWRQDPRWDGVERSYTAAEVVRLRGSVVPEQHCRRGSGPSGCGSSSPARSRCARSAP